MLCELGLPIRAARGQWQREIELATLRIDASSAEQALPHGRILRLCLLHVCDAARRANSVSVDLGESAAELAAKMGIAGKEAELIDQMHRILTAKISVSWMGGAELPVFDARSRPRGELAEWRPNLRLGAKFLSSLVSQAVPLDPRILQELGDSPLALDAYAWIRHSLSGEGADPTPTMSWADLSKRFGAPSQTVPAFRGIFETALRAVFDADQSIEIAVDDEGVSVRHALAEEAPAEPAAPVVAAPVVTAPPVAAPVAPAPVVAAPVVAAPAAPAMPAAPREQPRPTPPPAAAPRQERETDLITEDRICLPREATGLSQCIWLRRGHGSDQVQIGVTPGMRFDPDKLTVLAVEPMVLQVSGGLYQGDFDRVSSWITANRDLIDDFWDDEITSHAEIRDRVRKAPAPGWR